MNIELIATIVSIVAANIGLWVKVQRANSQFANKISKDMDEIKRSMSDIRLILAESYVTKALLEKEISNNNKYVDLELQLVKQRLNKAS